eukprot:scaffold429_cov321-Prasinococcus_capsulatus_cf.AAC.5
MRRGASLARWVHRRATAGCSRPWDLGPSGRSVQCAASLRRRSGGPTPHLLWQHVGAELHARAAHRRLGKAERAQTGPQG